MKSVLIALLLSPIASVFASALDDINSIPHLDISGKDAYRTFLTAQQHRAFVIAPGGVWAWKADETSVGSAAESALQSCRESTEQNCVVYAVDEKNVFNSRTWATLWGPYLTRAEAARQPIGVERGKRFFDLKFKDAAGKSLKLSDMHRKVVVLHFWGSWCPPCQQELPELQKLQHALRKSSGITMVLLQVRENFADSALAVKQLRLKLPLYDSEVKEKSDERLQLAEGGNLKDRGIAAVFPTTYVLDKHGVVLFSHFGPIGNWMEYLPLLKDAAEKSGK